MRRLSNGELMQCPKFNLETRNRCTMAMGHFGSHKVGGPYKITEVFITKCLPAGSCDFSLSDNDNHCVNCGTQKFYNKKENK